MSASYDTSILSRFRLDDRVVVITGASSGLGVAFANAVASVGADVVLAARRTERLAGVADELSRHGHRVLTARCDVREPADCAAMMASAVEAFGKVDVLVNNAGVAAGGPATREDPEQFRWMVETNLEGAYWCAQQFAKVAKPGSAIVNIASTLGLRPGTVPQAGYVSTKAAIVGLTRELAVQWTGRKGIRVNALAPGYFPSEMSDLMSAAERDDVSSRALLGRFGRLDELTPALLFLASDASSYVTASTFAIDGGLSMH